MTDRPGRLRAVYVTDTMCDVRMLEGLSTQAHLRLLAPASLGDGLANFWPPRTDEPVEQVLLGGGRKAFPLAAAWWLRRHRHDVDVAVVLDNLTAALAANLGHLAGGPPTVLQVGRPTIDYVRCQDRPLRLAAARALVAVNERWADGIGAVSEYVAAQSRLRNTNVAFIPWYGVDVQQFRNTMSPSEARAAIGLPDDAPIVMLRSRLAPEKDPHTFLRAVDRLRDEGRRFHAVYMGGEHAELTALAEERGTEVIAGKPATPDEIPLWYLAADIDVQTSRAEGLGVSPLESLACERPVVVSDVGGLPEVVDGGRVGRLVPVGDDAALAHELGSLLDDPDERRRLGTEGREWVVERFANDGVFDRWGDLLRSVVRPRLRATSTAVRVLFVDHETRLSGGQLDLVDLVRALPAESVEVHVALPGEGSLSEALARHGAQVHLVPMAESLRKVSRWELARAPWAAARHVGDLRRSSAELARLAAELRPDVVHTNSMKAHVLGRRAARTAGAPLVWHVRDILQPGWLSRAFVAAAGHVPDAVISLSHAAAEPFRGHRAEGRLHVVHNGVRPAPADPGAANAVRRSLGAGPDDLLVGIVGQIAHWKGQDVFVEAARLLADRLPHARFAVVGDCLFPENEAAFEAEARLRSEPLHGRLTWAGRLEPIEPVMAAFDVLVHASRLPEPFGRVIIEAMAQGTPVVTTEIGAGPELVSDQVGRRVPPGDPDALADAVADLGDPDRRATLSHAARAHAARFDIAATGAGVQAVWERLLEQA